MEFKDYRALGDFLVQQGVRRALFKELAENDNSKEQIYLGGSFEALNEIPFGKVRLDHTPSEPNFKAAVELFWIDDDRNVSQAKHAQLILYPKYPEVRLSGFLRGCPSAPRSHMQPVPKSKRRGTRDGRILVFGVTPDGRILAYLAAPTSPVATSLRNSGHTDKREVSVFFTFPIPTVPDQRRQILAALSDIVGAGWHNSCKLNRDGEIEPYRAPNAGGYTLEALLGVVPNGISGPDLLGWEVKAFSSDRITLMTPEPDRGTYGTEGVLRFLQKFGHYRDPDTIYFTGVHHAGIRREDTGMMLRVDGFEYETGKITNPRSGLVLESRTGEAAAVWSYARLLDHWGRKHNNAVYIRYTIDRQSKEPKYRYNPTISMGTGTEFGFFLRALSEGVVVYDPAPKATRLKNGRWKTKARNQFRIKFKDMAGLYHDFHDIRLDSVIRR